MIIARNVKMTSMRILPALALCVYVGMAGAQLYRWTDDKGRVHVTDTPPPASAKNVQKRGVPSTSSSPGDSTDSTFEPVLIQMVRKNYPVTLYTAPNCKDPCKLARDALNERGIPFTEVQVWDPESSEQLKRVSGGNEVPVMTVGRTAQKGFEKGAFDSLLDSAGYPRAGLLPRRAQAAPALPEGYVTQEARKAQAPPVAQPVKPAATDQPERLGPYAPRSQ